ncbi:GNAT family N-acetyltransferase [Pendulispora albinea]|uniref:GNAT family N-acetyltransferase n=1 Tax=Pendulispora albinea TaxID=2741071 RepID=A0ABZ2LMI8_9BACT
MPQPVLIPTLDTERLHLRGYRPDDLDACAAMYAAPEFTRHVSERPIPREDVWARMLRYIGHWSVFGFGFWAIEEKATGRYVGEAGLAYFKRDIEPPIDCPEAGWGLAPWAHGKGFATEIVRAIHTWYDAELGPTRTACIVRPANVASIRVAEKCGYRELQRVSFYGAPMIIFERSGAPRS